MAIWKDANGNLHDDMNGEALSLPSWPKGMVQLSASQIAALQQPTLAQVQSSQIDQVKHSCASAIVGGFLSSALGASHTYPSQPNDQTNLIGAVTASQSPGIPAGWTVNFWCADASGVWNYQAHTATQIQKVLADGVIQREAYSSKLASLVAQINSATTIPAVQAVIW